jgi:hypothetical protein
MLFFPDALVNSGWLTGLLWVSIEQTHAFIDQHNTLFRP